MIPIDTLNDLGLRFLINTIAMALLIFGMYYRRHGDRILATTAAMFNIFAFAVLGQLASVEFSLTAGFGLFAILALFNLRSETIGRIEIAYFFGAIAIAVICSIQGTDIMNVVAITSLALVGVYVVDHPALVKGSDAVKVTLDRIDPQLLSKPEDMKRILSERLGVDVTSYNVENLNYVNELAVVSLTFDKKQKGEEAWLSKPLSLSRSPT